MRSKIEANEYKDYILGFMFYKYLSDREVSFLKEEKYSDDDIKKVTVDDEKLVKHISENIGYFIAHEDLFSTWLSKGDNFDVSDVRDALSNFDTNIEPTYKKLFKNIFKTLQTGLSKLGETSTKQTKSIKALLKLIKRIPMDGKQDYDVLKARKTVDKFAQLVSKDKIRENEYNLNIPRYVDSSEGEEPWDIHAIMFGGIPKTEVRSLQKYWEAFPGLYEELFSEISEDYVTVESSDIEDIVASFHSVTEYIGKYKASFDGFEELLKEYLTLSSKKDKMAFIKDKKVVDWSTMSANKDGTFGKPAVNARILQLQMSFEFPEESLEAKMKQVMLLMDEESELKKVVKSKKAESEAATIETIENLEEEDALHLLELKWIKPILVGLETLPGDVISSMVSEIENLKIKYSMTYEDVENEKKATSKLISDMIGELSGSLDDMAGLDEFKKYMEDKDE